MPIHWTAMEEHIFDSLARRLQERQHAMTLIQSIGQPIDRADSDLSAAITAILALYVRSKD